MVVEIGNKKYELEYTFEAVLYEKCIEKVVELFGSIAAANEVASGKVDESVTKDVLKQMTSIPKTTITLFYAGLLEKNPVETEDDAKALLKQYFKENPDADNGTFYGMMAAIMSQMDEDGFFKQIGLMNEKQENQPKTLQAHKMRATTKKATVK